MSLKIKKDYSALKKLKKDLVKLTSADIEWGFFEEDRYGPENDNLPVAQVAYFNEFGEGNNPERAFFRNSVNSIAKRLAVLTAPIFEDVLVGRDYRPALHKVGEALRQSVKDSIENWFDALNSISWTKYKQQVGAPTKPLEYTQTMLNSVKYKLCRRTK